LGTVGEQAQHAGITKRTICTVKARAATHSCHTADILQNIHRKGGSQSHCNEGVSPGPLLIPGLQMTYIEMTDVCNVWDRGTAGVGAAVASTYQNWPSPAVHRAHFRRGIASEPSH
jgi:hypothetical protein